MITYAKVKDGKIVTYPYDISSLLLGNPTTKIGEDFDILLAFENTYESRVEMCTLEEVIQGAVPEYDPELSFPTTDEEASLVEGVWTIVTSIVDFTSEEIEARDSQVCVTEDAEMVACIRNRKAKYDALPQFEMQYDDNKNSTTTWVDAINAIKVEFPKPGTYKDTTNGD